MNRHQIKVLILSDNRAVERALLTLLSRQTTEEQQTSSTQVRNGRGFNAFDAERGTYMANWIKSGRSLSGQHIDRARQLVLRYVGQLEEVSSAKLNASTLHLNSGSLLDLDPFIQHSGG